MTTILKRLRHRKSARSVKGNSDARVQSDPRNLVYAPTTYFTKYSGDFLKYIVRPKKGVGRPPKARREQLFQQSCKTWGYTHPRTCALAETYAKYGDFNG